MVHCRGQVKPGTQLRPVEEVAARRKKTRAVIRTLVALASRIVMRLDRIVVVYVV